MDLREANEANESRHPEWIELTTRIIRVLAEDHPTVIGDDVFYIGPLLFPEWQREVDECLCKGKTIPRAWARAENLGYVEKMYADPSGLPADAPEGAFALVEVKSRRPESNQARLTVYRSLIYRADT
jgi:hypothetical protein